MNLTHPFELIAYPVDGRILEVLTGADASFTGRQVQARIGEHSIRGVQLGLARLSRQGIVTAHPAGRAILYRLNSEHLAAPHVRALAHLRYELVRRLRLEISRWDPHPGAAYVFGSVARRDSTATSDIDLCIVRPEQVSEPDYPAWRNQVQALAEAVTAWTGNDARIVEIGADEVTSMEGQSSPLLAAIRYEGISLVGEAA